MLRDEVWDEHVQQWQHCIRCAASESRLRTNKEHQKTPSTVPFGSCESTYEESRVPSTLPQFPVVFMLPFPDVVQEHTGSMYCSPMSGHKSPQVAALMNAMKSGCPYERQLIPYISALGCRPVNHKDPTKVQKPNATMNKSCRPRWQAELRLIDPVLVMVMGHHAFSACFPKKPKKGDYLSAVGSVLPFTLPGATGDITYCAYVAPDPYETILNARRSEWTSPFRYAPPQSLAKNPVAGLRWHVYRGLLFAKVLETNREKVRDFEVPETLTHAWLKMATAESQFYGKIDNVISAVAHQEELIRRTTALEMSELDVRQALSGEIETPTKRDIDDVPRISVRLK